MELAAPRADDAAASSSTHRTRPAFDEWSARSAPFDQAAEMAHGLLLWDCALRSKLTWIKPGR